MISKDQAIIKRNTEQNLIEQEELKRILTVELMNIDPIMDMKHVAIDITNN